VKQTGAAGAGARRVPAVHTLVISQHEGVRAQLVAYLARLPTLDVDGSPLTAATIIAARPDVVVLDLSRVDHACLRAAIDDTRRVGARLIALASMHEPDAEELVIRASGLYRLKSAGADGLAEAVLQVAARSPTNGRAATHLD